MERSLEKQKMMEEIDNGRKTDAEKKNGVRMNKVHIKEKEKLLGNYEKNKERKLGKREEVRARKGKRDGTNIDRLLRELPYISVEDFRNSPNSRQPVRHLSTLGFQTPWTFENHDFVMGRELIRSFYDRLVTAKTQDGHEKQNVYGFLLSIEQLFQLDSQDPLPSCTSQQYLISILSYATWIRLQPELFTEWETLMIEVVYRFIPATPEDIIVSLFYERCQTAVDLIRLCILGPPARRYPMRNVKPPVLELIRSVLQVMGSTFINALVLSGPAAFVGELRSDGVGWDVVSHHGIGNATLRIFMVLKTERFGELDQVKSFTGKKTNRLLTSLVLPKADLVLEQETQSKTRKRRRTQKRKEIRRVSARIRMAIDGIGYYKLQRKSYLSAVKGELPYFQEKKYLVNTFIVHAVYDPMLFELSNTPSRAIKCSHVELGMLNTEAK
ncbi:hypothetical protein G5I_07235 [Acromyrmex echinatior]|uniref:Uncharacterized protein n=1 Tax=Acromyrmex echinatior TaxID=103372 RepID=F4WN85_ACREC|nr:hypothetical protein G5I_07235 [Acromyrmex echinatior]